MLGLSYGEIFLIIGATAALIGPKDLPIIARTAGRLAGRAIGYVQLARGQFENIMEQTQYREVSKELQDLQAQVAAIQQGMLGNFRLNSGPLVRTVMDNPDQTDTSTGATIHGGPLNLSEVSKGINAQQAQHQQNQQQQYSFKAETSVFKEYGSVASVSSNLHSQATTYARLAESQALKDRASESIVNGDTVNDRPGLLSVLPISAESAGLLPNRQGEVTGSDIVLEAVLEAEVARNAKEFFSQPQNHIKLE